MTDGSGVAVPEQTVTYATYPPADHQAKVFRASISLEPPCARTCIKRKEMVCGNPPGVCWCVAIPPLLIRTTQLSDLSHIQQSHARTTTVAVAATAAAASTACSSSAAATATVAAATAAAASAAGASTRSWRGHLHAGMKRGVRWADWAHTEPCNEPRMYGCMPQCMGAAGMPAKVG